MHMIVALALFAVTNLLPPYESVQGIGRYATKDEYQAAATDTRFDLRKVEYVSSGLKVFAYVYAPAKIARPLPVIIYNRGSFVRDDFAAELIATFHRLGAAGFIVVAPLLRQSGGGEGRDEMGGADVDDVANVMSVVRNVKGADPSSVFLYGESRGGMMTYQAIRDGFPARAAAVFGAFTDLHGMLAASPQTMAMAERIWPDYTAHTAEIEARRSALAWAEKLDVPLLIMHGSQDRDVSPAQALALAERLQAAGKDYEIYVRAGSNHVMSDWRAGRDGLAVEWFRRHLPKPASSR